MSPLRRGLPLIAALALLACAPAARADFTEASLDSGNATVQADYAYEPAISADGHFLVFTGSLGGVTGVYRKDLQSGELDVVAYGDAGAASISSDGEFVAFTTSDTDPGSPSTTTGQCTSVYVRDMNVDQTQANPTEPAAVADSAYSLASALNGTTAGLTYSGSNTSKCPGGGSATAPGVSLSADGHEVAFTVVGQSDLTTGTSSAVSTPPAQVAVRNIQTDTTTLVSQTMASLGATPAPVSGGAALTDLSTVGDGADPPYPNPPATDSDDADSTASISGDGSTVAWEGIDIPSQAPASAEDASSGAGDNYPDEYDEPLWRRISDGPSSPTRRILGGDDPVPPCSGACTGPLDLQWPGETGLQTGDVGPERGSMLANAGFNYQTDTTSSNEIPDLTLSDAVPSLSADGSTVAVLSTQPLNAQIGADGNIPCNPCQANLFSTNAYVINMAPGLSRTGATTQLTEWAGYNFTKSSPAGTLAGIALSPQGDELAFVTRRTQFPLSPPTLISPALTEAASPQLYVVNLTQGTMEMATVGYDGQPANGAVATPSFSNDGGPIAFASAASNLVYGAQSDKLVEGELVGTEVFTEDPIEPSFTPGASSIGAPIADPTFKQSRTITASGVSERNGTVALTVTVPGAGKVRVSARATVPSVRATKPAKKAKKPAKKKPAKKLKKPKKPAKRSKGHSARRKTAEVRREVARTTRLTLARATGRLQAAGSLQIKLTPLKSVRAAIAHAHGLYATITITFTQPGYPALTETTPVEFLVPGRGPTKPYGGLS